MVTVLLYADDAALPAYSAADLQKSVDTFVDFCNEHRLYVSTAKTHVTVFHHPDDDHVHYVGRHVYVDGQLLDIQIYGKSLEAVPSFKYLGVHFDRFGSAETHFDARLKAFSRAANML
eukprot:3136049-Karenia_brevis.AAC.1